MTTLAERVIELFREGFALPNSAKIRDDAKLRVALELHRVFFPEISENDRFLTLVINLEALKPTTPQT